MNTFRTRFIALLGSVALSLTIIARPASAAEGPEPDMLALAERVARFIETLDAADIDGVFADGDVAIIENFAPYRFDGADAVADWAAGMRAHREATGDLHHVFGPPQDYSRTGDKAFFSLPTTWKGSYKDGTFTETGGWAFVLTKQRDGWRIQNYGWSVTGISTP
jgi:ketosteroid isomerase-like protein